jgi:tetratricopeptide (TPR) repeat protein
MNRHQRRAAAKSAKTALGPRATTPAALCELGFSLLQAGQIAEAEGCSRQALTQQPDCADALHLMGVVAFHKQQYDHAIDWIAGAIRQVPKPEYLLSLGNALQQAGRLDEALKAYDRGVMFKPEDAELWKSMGNVLVKLERSDEAVLSFQQALKFNPRHLEAANACAQLLFDLKRYDEALACFNQSDEIEPNRAAFYQMRGLCHARAMRFDEAMVDYRRALELDPGHAETHNNVGIVHLRFGRFDEASACFDRALALNPNVATTVANKAFALAEQHRFDEAFALYARSLTIDPDNASARWNLALRKMLTGDFEAGWAGREARWQASIGLVDRKFTQPLWLGDESIAGKTILLHADEGLGDAIQFVRYAPMVAALGARVILDVPGAIHSLLSGMSGVSQNLPRSFPMMPAFDVHCPLSSLPLAFHTRLETIPAPVSYLPAVPQARREEWQSRLGPHDRFRVGLVWSGSRVHLNDHNRSTALQALSPILDLDATFVSLQKEPRDQDKVTLRERADVLDVSEQLTDFVATAALVSCLDLVITVDTSVAHLVGALGCPVWIMLPFTPDYRWLLDRDDSPWYPTARLFRQTETRDYAPVIDRIRAELQNLIGAWRPAPEVAAYAPVIDRMRAELQKQNLIGAWRPMPELAEVPLVPSASPDKPALTS